jgi:RHS repeat-associated protein
MLVKQRIMLLLLMFSSIIWGQSENLNVKFSGLDNKMKYSTEGVDMLGDNTNGTITVGDMTGELSYFLPLAQKSMRNANVNLSLMYSGGMNYTKIIENDVYRTSHGGWMLMLNEVPIYLFSKRIELEEQLIGSTWNYTYSNELPVGFYDVENVGTNSLFSWTLNGLKLLGQNGSVIEYAKANFNDDDNQPFYMSIPFGMNEKVKLDYNPDECDLFYFAGYSDIGDCSDIEDQIRRPDRFGKQQFIRKMKDNTEVVYRILYFATHRSDDDERVKLKNRIAIPTEIRYGNGETIFLDYTFEDVLHNGKYFSKHIQSIEIRSETDWDYGVTIDVNDSGSSPSIDITGFPYEIDIAMSDFDDRDSYYVTSVERHNSADNEAIRHEFSYRQEDKYNRFFAVSYYDLPVKSMGLTAITNSIEKSDLAYSKSSSIEYYTPASGITINRHFDVDTDLYFYYYQEYDNGTRAPYDGHSVVRTIEEFIPNSSGDYVSEQVLLTKNYYYDYNDDYHNYNFGKVETIPGPIGNYAFGRKVSLSLYDKLGHYTAVSFGGVSADIPEPIVLPMENSGKSGKSQAIGKSIVKKVASKEIVHNEEGTSFEANIVHNDFGMGLYLENLTTKRTTYLTTNASEDLSILSFDLNSSHQVIEDNIRFGKRISAIYDIQNGVTIELDEYHNILNEYNFIQRTGDQVSLLNKTVKTYHNTSLRAPIQNVFVNGKIASKTVFDKSNTQIGKESYEYNSDGRLSNYKTWLNSANYAQTDFTYDFKGRMIEINYPENIRLQFSYLSRTITYQGLEQYFGSLGSSQTARNVTQIVYHPESGTTLTTRFGYDIHGRIIAQKRLPLLFSTYSYDAFNRIKTINKYNFDNSEYQVVQENDYDLLLTEQSFGDNLFDQLTPFFTYQTEQKRYFDVGLFSSELSSYNFLGQKTKSKIVNNSKSHEFSQSHYLSSGELLKSWSYNNLLSSGSSDRKATSEIEYDYLGRPVREENVYSDATTTSYQKLPFSSIQSAYPSDFQDDQYLFVRKETVIAPEGNKIENFYGDNNHLLLEKQFEGTTVAKVLVKDFDILGRVVKSGVYTTSPSNLSNVFEFSYDYHGNVVTRKVPDVVHIDKYVYNGNDQLIGHRTPGFYDPASADYHKWYYFTYDGVGRLLKKSLYHNTDGSFSFSYEKNVLEQYYYDYSSVNSQGLLSTVKRSFDLNPSENEDGLGYEENFEYNRDGYVISKSVKHNMRVQYNFQDITETETRSQHYTQSSSRRSAKDGGDPSITITVFNHFAEVGGTVSFNGAGHKRIYLINTLTGDEEFIVLGDHPTISTTMTAGNWYRFKLRLNDDGSYPGTEYRISYPVKVGERLTASHNNPEVVSEINYGYDFYGNLANMTYPSGEVINYANLDEWGRLNSIPGYINNIDYNLAGNLSFFEFANGIDTRFTHDKLFRVIEMKTQYGGIGNFTPVSGNFYFHQKYAYDRNSNIETIHDAYYDYGGGIGGRFKGIGGQSKPQWKYYLNKEFSYDDLNQLATANYYNKDNANIFSESYSYSPEGNILSKGGVSYTYYDGTNKLRNVSDRTADFIYDEAGNVIRMNSEDDRQLILTYGHENLLRKVEIPSIDRTEEYLYNADGQRVTTLISHTGRSSIKHYVLGQGQKIISEISDSQITYDFIYANGKKIAQINKANNDRVELFHLDHLGSTRGISLSNGSELMRADYTPFGQDFVLSGSGTDYKYTGKERNNFTGLDYFGARFYDADLGRWLSVDPLASNRFYLSTYNYVQNNPIIRIDPDGKIDYKAIYKGSLQVMGGASALIGGISMAAAGAASEGATAGLSSPVSLPAIAVGVSLSAFGYAEVVFGLTNIVSGLNTPDGLNAKEYNMVKELVKGAGGNKMSQESIDLIVNLITLKAAAKNPDGIKKIIELINGGDASAENIEAIIKEFERRLVEEEKYNNEKEVEKDDKEAEKDDEE